jgi:hypothetical protein
MVEFKALSLRPIFILALKVHNCKTFHPTDHAIRGLSCRMENEQRRSEHAYGVA